MTTTTAPPANTNRNRRWLLAKRPQGPVREECFAFDDAGAVAQLDDGEILVRNLAVSCEPAQHGWMTGETYLPPVAIGDVMRAVSVGEVVASRTKRFRAGELVQGLFGWQELARVAAGDDSGDAGAWPTLKVPPGTPVEVALGLLGPSGLAAYFGMIDVGRPRPGETVVVSAAAGATGSVAAQIAKIAGCRVVGIAGGAEKCRYLVEELGLDDAIDYKSENLHTRLRRSCPGGIDVYFDNVGGRTLDAALLHLALRGRVVLCGAIAGYTSWPNAGPAHYTRLLRQRGRMEGFIVLDFLPRVAEATAALLGWLAAGRLQTRVDVEEGLENAPRALMRVFAGENAGKQLVRLTDAYGNAAGGAARA